jgi:hypothetical protein
VSMDILWHLLGGLGDLWESLEILGDLWESLEIFGDLWESLGIFGDLWESLGIFGDLLRLALLKIRLFSLLFLVSHARSEFPIFSCKMRLLSFLMQDETFWFFMQDEIFQFSHSE